VSSRGSRVCECATTATFTRDLLEAQHVGALVHVAVLVNEGHQVIHPGLFGADGLGGREHAVSVAGDLVENINDRLGVGGLHIQVVLVLAAGQADVGEFPAGTAVGKDVGGVGGHALGAVNGGRVAQLNRSGHILLRQGDRAPGADTGDQMGHPVAELPP